MSLSRRLPLDLAPDHSQIHQPCKSLGYICLLFHQALCQCGERTWKRAGPGYFEPISLSLPPCYFPKGRGGGGVCLSNTALRIPLPDPSSPRAPIPEWRVPAQGQARPMKSRQDMSLALTRGTPRPTPSRRPPRCTATFWACLRMVSHAASVAGKLLGHCPAPCMRHFSYRPWPSRSGSQCGHAGTWRNFGGRLQWRPGCRLCSLPSHVALAQQPSAPCTRPGPSSQVRRARSFVLTRSIPPPSSSLNPEAHLI